MSNRLQWIDLCKAIGIYLVVLGHFLPVAAPLKIIIYSFHVPLFFILSGYLLKIENSWGRRMLRRARLLLLPYLGFAAVSLAYYWSGPISAAEIISRLFFLNGETIWNDPLWFLFVLFIVELIAYTLFSCFPGLIKNNKINMFLAIGIFIVGYFVYLFRPSILIFFGMDKTICLLGFYLLGYLLKQTQFIDNAAKLRGRYLGAVVFLVNCIISLVLNWNDNISVYYLDLNNYFVFLFTSVVGSVSLMCFCHGISINYFIKSVSNHTIFIMGTHYVFLLLYTQIVEKIRIDSILFCLMVLALYTLLLSWWDKRAEGKSKNAI